MESNGADRAEARRPYRVFKAFSGFVYPQRHAEHPERAGRTLCGKAITQWWDKVAESLTEPTEKVTCTTCLRNLERRRAARLQTPPPPPPGPQRCDEEHTPARLRCNRKEGHRGRHRNGIFAWE